MSATSCNWPQCNRSKAGRCFAWCKCRCHDQRSRTPTTPEPSSLSAEDTALVAALADNERLRARIHEAVNECQARHAVYVSRCAQFDIWKKWARDHFERSGDNTWSHGSEVNRLLILGLIEERDNLAAELADERRRAGEREAALLRDYTRWLRGHHPTTARLGVVQFVDEFLAQHPRAALAADEPEAAEGGAER